ncbi:IS21 family transposase [Erysipelothrix larvae]|nr:IS21 family transposase [Erysipelothrix larvae]
MSKYSIITLKKKGWSNRKIALELGIDRKTVARYLQEYNKCQIQLIDNHDLSDERKVEVIDQIVGDRHYDASKRGKRKLTQEIQARIIEIMDSEKDKDMLLGRHHKQKLTVTQIFEIIKSEGHDIGQTTIRNFVHEIQASRETFIRQDYRYGERLEFDFGEVKLLINGELRTYYLAVFSSPASGYRYAYLYPNQRKQVFIDAHVRFFEHSKGSWGEVVYDNMRNVVKRFITPYEKEINDDCLKLALYYNFEINLTNIRSGHEKGSVENSVKVIRNRVFAKDYKFETFEEACVHLEQTLDEINIKSSIEDEKKELQPYRIPYEFADIEVYSVDKYGCIHVENNFYSVPDYLQHKRVTVKNTVNSIRIYSNHTFVYEHKKIDGHHQYQLVLDHYLNTMMTKPGSVKNSLVLKQHPELYNIYHNHYKTRTKEFIEILQENRNETYKTLKDALKYRLVSNTIDTVEYDDSIQEQSRKQLKKISQLMH